MRHNIEDAVDGGYSHIPVLWREVVDYVEESSSGTEGYFVDCTLGEGGHTALILKHFPDLKVIAFERDSEIIEIAKKRLQKYHGRINFINSNFSDVFSICREITPEVNFILYDFGISSFHFDESGRGFSFAKDEILDMRLDDVKVSASDVVNDFDEKRLADIIFTLGEERWSRKIAYRICEERKKGRIETTGQLANLVLGAIPKRFHVKNIHPATRVFQALRIFVNNELEAISESLKESYTLLVPGGRMMAISFHSLEDRIAKKVYRQLARGCVCGNEPQHCMCNNKSFVKILTKKPVIAQSDELNINNRSRSAKLRVCERL